MSMNGQVTFTDEFGVTHFLTDEEAIERFGHVEEHHETDTPKRSFLSTLKPFDAVAPNGWKIFVKAYVQIGQSLLSPGVIYGLLTSSISLGRLMNPLVRCYPESRLAPTCNSIGQLT